MRIKSSLRLVGLAGVTLGIVVACQSTATPTPAANPQAGIAVNISDNACPTLGIQVGQQIRLINQGKAEHMVRAKLVNGKGSFSSGALKSGDSFAVTLAQPGVYAYDCSDNGSLTGKITVEP